MAFSADTCAQFTSLALCALATTAFAVNPIVVQEQEFVDSETAERFMLIGVDYQPGGQGAYGTGSGDPLSNATVGVESGIQHARCWDTAMRFSSSIANTLLRA